ncbi:MULTISPECIES: fatty acid desaturase [Burkholderia]|uniref:DesA/ISL3 alpha bundle tail domain-containing protein n=1 Tax=Burkholderia TaxID=32008 RepID=UPI002795EC0B|nr:MULTISPECIES: fatty acid desaturase [Burkholderia]
MIKMGYSTINSGFLCDVDHCRSQGWVCRYARERSPGIRSHAGRFGSGYGVGTPDDWLEPHVYARYPSLGVGLLAVIDVGLSGLPGVSAWAIQMMWIPFWAGGVVNGGGHFGGYRNIATSDASTNLFPLGILIGGEELHNNHHAYVTSARLSNRWFEFDIGWLYIRLLAALRLATIRRVATKPRLLSNKAVVDDATLQAIIRNRHEVMAAYARMFERACRWELRRIKDMSRDDKRAFVLGMKRWLRQAWGYRDKPDQQALTSRNASRRIRVYVERYEALLELWAWSHASREQLLVQLQNWCRYAEQSDVTAIADFSIRLRRYT